MLNIDKCPLFLHIFRMYYFLVPSVFNTINYVGNTLNHLAQDIGLKCVLFKPLKCPINKNTPFKEVCILIKNKNSYMYYIFNYNALFLCAVTCYCAITQDVSMKFLRLSLVFVYPSYKTLQAFGHDGQYNNENNAVFWLSYWFFIMIYESTPAIFGAFFSWNDVFESCFLYLLVRFSIMKRWIRDSMSYIQEEIILKKNYNNISNVFNGLLDKVSTRAQLIAVRLFATHV